jgi:hypothetical protein
MIKMFLQAVLGLALSIMLLVIGVGGYDMATASDDSVRVESTEAYPIVFYQELKNLGGGNYLCEVWTQYRVDATIIKLTASEKAKLQRSYIK